MTIQSIIHPIIKPVIRSIVGADNFSPFQLPNLAIWLDAFDLPSNTTLASSWLNKGNMGVGNAIQATPLRQPLYVANGINGRPALRGLHDGVNASQLDIADHPALRYTQFTIYAVFQRTADTGAPETIGAKYTADGTNRREHWAQINGGGTVDSLNLTVSPGGTSTGLQVLNGTVAQPINTPRIARYQFTGTQLEIETIGFSQTTVNYAGAVFNGTSKYTLFSRPEFASPLNGLIGTYLFYTVSHDTNKQNLMINYLKNKYGI
jgi:hypothetical protein